MNWSYWEQDLFSSPYDIVIVGAGFSGLSTAYFLARTRPELSIAVLEERVIQRAASTRNAGMACISSISELIDDVEHSGWAPVLKLVEQRWRGLKLMQQLFPAELIDFRLVPAGELFFEGQKYGKDRYLHRIDEANEYLKEITGSNYFSITEPFLGTRKGQVMVKHREEGQIHPGRLHRAWMNRVRANGVDIFEGVRCLSHEKKNEDIYIRTSGPSLSTKQLLVCTNGEAGELLKGAAVHQVQNHVFVFAPKDGVDWSGNLHAESGYIYARNIGHRLLVGGARHITTDKGQELGNNDEEVRSYLMDFASEYLWTKSKNELPQPEFEWTGYLGVGPQKTPLLKEWTPGVFALCRLSGMGVALSTYLGQKTAAKLIENL
jgi:glycine/D-amino acid oxidase-like deaminating enzyme